MLRILLLIIVYHLSTIWCYGQKYYLSIGPNVNFAKDAFKYSSSRPVGAGLDFSVDLSARGAVNFHTGYVLFKNTYVPEDNVGYIPIRLGYQYFLFKKKIYIFSDAGTGLLFSPDNTKAAFSFAAGAGTKLPLKRNNFIQLQTFYSYTNSTDQLDYGWVTIQIAYGIKFGEKKK